MTRRTDPEIEQELGRVQSVIYAAGLPARVHHLVLARTVLRDRLTPGQVSTAYGNGGHNEETFNAAMHAASWMLGLVEQRPSST